MSQKKEAFPNPSIRCHQALLPLWSPQFTQMQKEGRRPHLLRGVSLLWDGAAFGKYHQPQYSRAQTGVDPSTLLGLMWFWTKAISRLTSDWA